MKIAILIRGPIRPDLETVSKNIKNLKNSFSTYELDTFLFCWQDPQAYRLIESGLVDHIIQLKEPSTAFCAERLKTRCTTTGPLFDRNYKMFWSQKLALEVIKSMHVDYDWIITTRPDLSIEIGDPEQWLNQGFYTMPMPLGAETGFTDQFGIANTQTMYDAWNYHDLKTLNEIYKISLGPENCLDHIMQLNRVKQKAINAKYLLSPNRHYRDMTYPYRYRAMLFNTIEPLIILLQKIIGKDRVNKIISFLRNIFPYK